MSANTNSNDDNFRNNAEPEKPAGLFDDRQQATDIDMFGRPTAAPLLLDDSSNRSVDDSHEVLVDRFGDVAARKRIVSEGISDGRVDFTAITQAITASKSDVLDDTPRSMRKGLHMRSLETAASQGPSFGRRKSSAGFPLSPPKSGRHMHTAHGSTAKKMTAKQSHMNSMILNLAHNNQGSSVPIGAASVLSASNSLRAMSISHNRQSRSEDAGADFAFTTISAPHSPTSNNLRQSMLNMKLKRRSEQLATSLSEFQQKLRTPQSNSKIVLPQRQDEQPTNFARRFKVGDYVLVRNSQSKWANLVNRYGFPQGAGETDEERRGPYNYVLATITKLHFEEIKTYYTVARCDTGADQRADVEFMEPLRSPRGELAALKAATESSGESYNGLSHLSHSILPSDDITKYESSDPINSGVNKRSRWRYFRKACYSLVMWPLHWIWNILRYTWEFLLQGMLLSCLLVLRRNARLFLYGKEPYICQMRLTMINLVVLCSTWLMFIDQVRLGFMPPTADKPVAVINLCVWVILCLELIFEVFIRPDGFNRLIISEKAFSPVTVRYINSFHFVVESISLLVFVPEFFCILSNQNCSQRYPFSFYNAALMKVIGPTRLDVAFGYFYLCLVRLRVLGLVRHWKNMWIGSTFMNQKWIKSKQKQRNGLLANIIPLRNTSVLGRRQTLDHSSKILKNSTNARDESAKYKDVTIDQKNTEGALVNACNIGTALMVVNSYRTLAIMWAITGVFPCFLCLMSYVRNDSAYVMTSNLQGVNLLAQNESSSTCDYLISSVTAWVTASISQSYGEGGSPSLLTVELGPDRCGFNTSDQASLILCDTAPFSDYGTSCDLWKTYQNLSIPADVEQLATATNVRLGSIIVYKDSTSANFTNVMTNATSVKNYTVLTSFDFSFSVQEAAKASLLLQICLLIAVLGGLSALRRDAEVLVLGPLRRMLRIVARYAKNPLVPPKVSRKFTHNTTGGRVSGNDDSVSLSDDDEGGDSDSDDFALGSYETEQLITAVAKITDLLRKCWGVAGADIISTNLASREGALTEVFNPTVPGKSVYALFGFAAIGGFDNAVRNLGGDIMPLINDIAAVLHGEVFRWGFGDSGQCNKNLGGAFLMVFRIGLVKDVVKKLEEATNVVFNTKSSEASSAARRKKNKSQARAGSASGAQGYTSSSGSTVSQSRVASLTRKIERNSASKARSLSLQSLPGITNFTDRAVIGMLKSYAGIYRDRKILGWNDDFRLGAGVGAFSINMIYGMDAGWAVEGAVGSEYKIDATYLSPHVNMASRMTSACKQYGVTIMLSQSVQELMSDVAQTKLRHLDTITVKGSSVKQKIYTYDARARGVDFFLYSRSDEQADFDAEHVSPNIWHNDQDLKAMRQHVTEDFLSEFRAGHKAYISGDWITAMKRLERANDIMLETAFDEGYLEDEFDALQMRAGDDVEKATEELRLENGDGPSMYLLNFMKSYGGVVPKNWDGWHPLTRK